MALPTEALTYQFEKSHATVIYRAEHSAATDRVMPHLDVMVIDQYRYQREFSVRYRWEPGDSSNLYWEWQVYRHPGRRNAGKVSQCVAERFILKFLELTRYYPGLLFNAAGDHATDPTRPRCEGFVHLAEYLHDGYEFSVKLLR